MGDPKENRFSFRISSSSPVCGMGHAAHGLRDRQVLPRAAQPWEIHGTTWSQTPKNLGKELGTRLGTHGKSRSSFSRALKR